MISSELDFRSPQPILSLQMDNSKKNFQSAFDKAREKGKLVKTRTVGGVTHETWRQPDGREWMFAYYVDWAVGRAENDVANSAEKAETPA